MKSLSVRLVGVLIIGLLIFGHVEAWGADWRYLGKNEQGKSFYDTESITRPFKNVVRVLARWEYNQNGVSEIVKKLGKKYEGINYTISVEEINCSDKKKRILSLTDYSKEGKIIFSSSNGSEWENIIPGTYFESLYKAVCK